jgi:hypothetical protein
MPPISAGKHDAGCTPSMKQRIDVAALYDDTLAALPWTLDDNTPPLPIQSPIAKLFQLLTRLRD